MTEKIFHIVLCSYICLDLLLFPMQCLPRGINNGLLTDWHSQWFVAAVYKNSRENNLCQSMQPSNMKIIEWLLLLVFCSICYAESGEKNIIELSESCIYWLLVSDSTLKQYTLAGYQILVRYFTLLIIPLTKTDIITSDPLPSATIKKDRQPYIVVVERPLSQIWQKLLFLAFFLTFDQVWIYDSMKCVNIVYGKDSWSQLKTSI